MVPTALVYSEFYNNGEFGIVAAQLEDNAKIMFEDVTVKNNAYGIAITGTGITVNNANIRNNNLYGLEISREVLPSVKNEITLDGHISITNN